jgi:hypothetical protein
MTKISRLVSMYKIKARVSLRDFGVLHTLTRGVSDVLFGKIILLRHYIIYEKQLPQSAAPELRNPDINFSFLSADDTGLIVQIEALSGISREFITEKMSHGSHCIIARKESSLVGFNLVNIGKTNIRYLDVFLNLADIEAWSEQITVSLEYRRGGLASDLRHLMFAHLSARGYKKLIGGYVPFNVKSGLLAKKLGFVETEKITMIKIFGWKKLYRQSLLQGIPPSLSLDIS